MTDQSRAGEEPDESLPDHQGGRVIARPIPESGARIVDWARAAEPSVTGQTMLPGTGVPTLALEARRSDSGPDWGRSGSMFVDGLDGCEESVESTAPVVTDERAQRGDHGSAGELPDPEAWSRWLAQLMVEVVHGRRPAAQLARWTDERALATVVLRTRQLGHGRPRPRTTTGSGSETRHTHGVGVLRVQRPTAVAVEASAVIRGRRSSALAFRLEAQAGRWVCTDVDFGPQTPQPS